MNGIEFGVGNRDILFISLFISYSQNDLFYQRCHTLIKLTDWLSDVFCVEITVHRFYSDDIRFMQTHHYTFCT